MTQTARATRYLALIAAVWSFVVAPVTAQVPRAPTPRPADSAATQVVFTGATQPLAPGQAIPADQLEAFVDGAVTEAMRTDHLAGVAVSVVQNGQVILKKGYGVDRDSPARAVDPDRTLFRIGSISKTFAWIALMNEVEAGRIRLEAPINIYLPEKIQIPDQGYKRAILVRDLMSHSPGFEDRALGQLFEKDPKRIRPMETYLRQERPSRVREAGSLPTYSNYGVGLAGEALARVTGKTWQALSEGRILRPLGMNRTTFREPYPAREGLPAPMAPQLAGDLSHSFRWTGATFQPREVEYLTSIAPVGAASSTASDMARYMLAILGDGTLEGATVYSPATAKAFRTSLGRGAPGVNGWSHGFMEYTLPGGYRGYGHGGATLYFHSNMVTVPALGLGIFVTSNTDTGRPFAARLPGEIVGRFYAQRSLPLAGAKSLYENRKAYEGRYLTTRRAYGGLEKFVNLFEASATVSATKDGRLITVGDAGVRTWAPTANPAVFRETNGADSLVFRLKNGRADRWFGTSGTAAYERAGPLTSVSLLAALALIALIASLATIGGIVMRARKDLRETRSQKRASLAQTSAAVLWLLSAICFWVWTTQAEDVGNIFYDFPGPLLLVASSCAFVAALLTLVCLALLPFIWRGGRRLESWTVGRKVRFTATTMIFSLFAILLALWGALEPWSR